MTHVAVGFSEVRGRVCLDSGERRLEILDDVLVVCRGFKLVGFANGNYGLEYFNPWRRRNVASRERREQE